MLLFYGVFGPFGKKKTKLLGALVAPSFLRRITKVYINDVSLRKAEWFATLSALAYKSEKTHKQFFQAEGIGAFKSLDKDGTQAIMYYNGGEIGVVFRGTQPTEFKDILADMDIRKKKAKKDDGFVHSGFQESLDDLWEDIVSFINNCGNYTRLYFAGHSLGAALAVLAASRINRCTVYTFGCPRVGGRKFVKQNKNILHWRFVNNNDIVTRIPTFIRWKHHGYRVYIDRRGKVSSAVGLYLFTDLILGHLSSWAKLKPFDSFSDHSILKYVKHIKASTT